MRSRLLSIAAVLTIGGSSSAQTIVDLPTLGSSWTDVGYPKIYWTPTNGASFGLYYAQVRPPGYDDWDDPPPYRARIALDGEIATSGSHRLGLEFKLPNSLPGWRFDLRLWTIRHARQNYFGIGNESEFESDNVTDGQPFYYRMDRRRSFVRGTVQRRLISGLRAVAGFHFERWRLDTLSGPSLLGEQVQAGLAPLVGVNTWQGEFRLGMVLDTRDDEVTPRRGVLIEALFGIADSSVVGDVNFTRFTGSAAVFHAIGERLVLGGRVVGQTLSGSPPVGSYFAVEASERAFEGLGGASSHRGLHTDRFLGQDKLLANIDARYRLTGLSQMATVDLVGFIDFGRVFQASDDFSLKALHVGGGVGPIITIGRNGVIGWTFAWGPDKLIVQTHTRWMF